MRPDFGAVERTPKRPKHGDGFLSGDSRPLIIPGADIASEFERTGRRKNPGGRRHFAAPVFYDGDSVTANFIGIVPF
jgi:hypothetical protein